MRGVGYPSFLSTLSIPPILECLIQSPCIKSWSASRRGPIGLHFSAFPSSPLYPFETRFQTFPQACNIPIPFLDASAWTWWDCPTVEAPPVKSSPFEPEKNSEPQFPERRPGEAAARAGSRQVPVPELPVAVSRQVPVPPAEVEERAERPVEAVQALRFVAVQAEKSPRESWSEQAAADCCHNQPSDSVTPDTLHTRSFLHFS